MPTPYVFGDIGVYLPDGWVKESGLDDKIN
jgi:hypothetical protein